MSSANVSSKLTAIDLWHHFTIRLGINRDQRRVKTGIYSIGKPDQNSNVFVSANFQMSFNKLRAALDGINAWILVINTNAINVWCAAGKGSFGTAELVSKIKEFKLGELIRHKNLILPQLSAPGISAHEVKKHTGFNVIYGPVRAKDIKGFLENGLRATKEMRRVNFTLLDRAVLTPIEFIIGLKYGIWGILFLYLISGNNFTPLILSLILSLVAGSIITPLLLPFIPFRAFSLKGWAIGLLVQILFLLNFNLAHIQIIGSLLVFPSISAFLALNFTGCSTYTSPSGVRKEMKLFMRPILLCAITGCTLIVLSVTGVI